VVVYLARVRVTVWSGDRSIFRDAHGTGEASASSAGEAHDRALKSAETDATKRALATFGKAFGLALYAGAGDASKRSGRDTSKTQDAGDWVISPTRRPNAEEGG